MFQLRINLNIPFNLKLVPEMDCIKMSDKMLFYMKFCLTLFCLVINLNFKGKTEMQKGW
jgi:hypothetical protein